MHPDDPPPHYADVVRRIHAIEHATCEVIGEATDHPMWGLTFGEPAAGRIPVLLTSGIHGDEPAPIEATLQFLEGFGADYLDRFWFRVVPCANPSGFEARTRENGSGQDINRSMSDDTVVESVTLRNMVQGQAFTLFFDLHEDYEATGFYMYEIEAENRLLGDRIVEQVKQIGPIDGDENSDEGLDEKISEGLFAIQEKWREQGWSAWAYFEAAQHAILPESPSTPWPLQQRVDAHHAALRIVLDHYRDND